MLQSMGLQRVGHNLATDEQKQHVLKEKIFLWSQYVNVKVSQINKLLYINVKVLVVQSYLTLYDPMDCSTPGFPVLQYLPEFAQTHVH